MTRIATFVVLVVGVAMVGLTTERRFDAADAAPLHGPLAGYYEQAVAASADDTFIQDVAAH